MTISVQDTLDAYIKSIETERKADGLWHPSSLFSCERQALYELRGTEPSNPRTARSRRILRQGTNLHEMVQEAMIRESGATAVYNEVGLSYPEYGITGHSDTLLEWDESAVENTPWADRNLEYELFEFKSIGGKSLEWALRKGELPKPEHEGQARCYAMILRRKGGMVDAPPDEDHMCPNCTTPWKCNGPHLPPPPIVIPPLGDRLTRIQIAYFSRDDLKVEPFELTVSEAWEAKFEERMERLEGFRADDTALPERLPLDAKGKKNWLCESFCLFRDRCWNKDGEGRETA